MPKTFGFDQSEETCDKTSFDELTPLVQPSVKIVKKSVKDKAEKVTLQSGVIIFVVFQVICF